MKTMKFLLTLILLIPAMAYSQDKLSTRDQSVLESKVTEMFNTYVTHVNTKGLPGVEAFFSKSKDFYWVEDGLLQYPDANSLEAAIAAFAPTVKTVNLEITEFKARILGPTKATVYADFKQDISLESGFSFSIDGIMTIILAKEAEGWKFLSGHSSVEKPRTNQ